MCGCPTGEPARNPSMCPDWESNQRPFDLQARTQPLSHTSQGYRYAFRALYAMW